MTTISIVKSCSLSPDEVLEAAHDFSARREQVFPAVRLDRLQVHDEEAAGADVTEGTPVGPLGANWERCDYDWSQPGSVSAVVTDSNVYAVPGSSWRITATPRGDGSEVEMVWERRFKRNPRGLLFGTLFRVVGKPIFGRYAGDIIENLEGLDRPAR